MTIVRTASTTPPTPIQIRKSARLAPDRVKVATMAPGATTATAMVRHDYPGPANR